LSVSDLLLFARVFKKPIQSIRLGPSLPETRKQFTIFERHDAVGLTSPLKAGGYVLWRKLYESCVAEANPERFEKLVCETERAIFLRDCELSTESNASDEVQALKQATKRLSEIKIKKLGRPDRTRGERGFFLRAVRRVEKRIRISLLGAEQAWVNWVFKSSK